MNWIEVTHSNSEIGKFWVNLDFITSVFSYKGKTKIAYSNGDNETINEDLQYLSDYIKSKQKKQ